MNADEYWLDIIEFLREQYDLIFKLNSIVESLIFSMHDKGTMIQIGSVNVNELINDKFYCPKCNNYNTLIEIEINNLWVQKCESCGEIFYGDID